MNIFKFIAVFLLILSAMTARAAPIGFKGSSMWMGDFSSDWQETFVNYAFTLRDAVGVEGVAMKSDRDDIDRSATSIIYTHLAHRWNLPSAQANIWLFAGIGSIRGDDFSGSRTLYTPGIQIDYETPRIYLAANTRLYRANHINNDYASARAGFSFYEVNYDEIQPWVVVEARRMNELSEKTEVTPMLRLIHNRYFAEFGYSNMSQVRFNFMYIF